MLFRSGMTEQYSCNNYEDAKDSKQFIYDNLMRQHKTLPMGEFAIGTNTAAYSMGKRFQISEKLPILIAEKTGPHIAIGDTCFSMSEEIAVFNSDGKEVIARDNEISILRKQDVTKAYFSCHTDITIPYDELEFIKVITRAGQTIELIRDGRFVLESAMWLNSLFY